jgi:hypothetical protein
MQLGAIFRLVTFGKIYQQLYHLKRQFPILRAVLGENGQIKGLKLAVLLAY